MKWHTLMFIPQAPKSVSMELGLSTPIILQVSNNPFIILHSNDNLVLKKDESYD